MPDHYDVIVIGTGAGGGTLADTLAPSGKRILLLERGNFLPRETDNWDSKSVFLDGKYISPDTWYDADGKAFQPQVHYFVGGATKLYGAALYRLRPQDFGELKHVDGISPAWPLSYDDFEPWYTKAEWLYQVHGNHGDDPTEGHWSKQYPWPAVSHEPRIQEITDNLAAAGYHPFTAPCGILLDEADRRRSTCIRCTWCDGYPCMVHAKSDAETIAVRPLLTAPNVTLLVEAEVVKLETDPTGGRGNMTFPPIIKLIAFISRLLHQATIKGKAIKSNQFREVRSDSFSLRSFAFFAAILLFSCSAQLW